MPIQLNRVVGKEYPPYAVTVERARIKDFARAIGDLNPFYLDDEIASSPRAVSLRAIRCGVVTTPESHRFTTASIMAQSASMGIGGPRNRVRT
jgi:acyl dehydratase